MERTGPEGTDDREATRGASRSCCSFSPGADFVFTAFNDVLFDTDKANIRATEAETLGMLVT